MGQPIIVLGDRTSHGGTVIGCAPSSSNHGKHIARVGDMVSCPRCRGVFPISQGDPGLTDDGKPVAYHGCKVACGAVLLASQAATITEPAGGGATGAPAQGCAALIAQGFGVIGSGLIASNHDEPLDPVRQRFRGRFQVLDRASGEPMAGQAVRVRSTGGQYLTAHTDGEGFTPWVERDANEALAFDLIEGHQA